MFHARVGDNITGPGCAWVVLQKMNLAQMLKADQQRRKMLAEKKRAAAAKKVQTKGKTPVPELPVRYPAPHSQR